MDNEAAWQHVGATPMIGQNDYSTERFGLPDAESLLGLSPRTAAALAWGGAWVTGGLVCVLAGGVMAGLRAQTGASSLMTAEALSNVHRHTASRNVRIGLTVVDNSLGLTVENDASGELPSRFTPLSIFERAEALGARTEVLSEDGKTRIHVEVPL